ncbi:ribosomal protein S18 acetylase RimI-like enzyme [Novosphingobium hassiacum]|uniref:Ribosomal protein S18 acetylase RimI-like enzyme n=1 Tax=Novosphingobium hassiacum TaxID=173676 RepID=A0A7W6EXB5_9SPHN|nr:GNAT family acetyltransferase [Novosphingobium hassiacum]MBB3861890.1 ribosomal protein S18 acetylase RimI-like enzyme [Novosphingobium hassiacum]
MTDPTIRPATPADREAVVALWRATGLTRPWNDPHADFDTAIGSPASAVLLACDGAALVGSVMVGFDGHRGWVYYVATAPDQRGRGLGRLLMAQAEAWLATRGCPKIQLMVRGDNHAARGFYDAIGYDLQDVVTLGKRLD